MGEWTRRGFVTAATAGVATALSTKGRPGASDKVRVAVIGSGGRGLDVWKRFLKQPDVEGVAVADVYAPFLARGVEAAGGRTDGFKDFRRILDRKDVDAVLVATPDHWHALMTVMACQSGKDVYVEKPLSLTVREGRVMADAARKHGRVVQCGSQQRSGAHYGRALKLMREAGIGPVHRVSAGFARNVMPGFVARELQKSLTADLDWDLWLGPAPLVPFDPLRCIYHFRWFWSYSGGQMTNWGAHNLDIARWALEAKGPAAVTGFGGRFAVKDGGETPDVQEIVYHFPEARLGGGEKGCVVTWSASENNKGRGTPLEFHGTRGTLALGRGGFTVTPETWEGHDQKDEPVMARIEDPGSDLDDTHVRNFLDCVKSRKRPNADVEEAHRTAAMCHLGNIVTRIGRSIVWDAEKELVVGDADATKWLSYEYRRPWTLGA